ncbi:hypothetical protein DMN91_008330 [Ooceraea biroi]|nr:hypothetical protein DMN91_008330 [Ooceraea biroi]
MLARYILTPEQLSSIGYPVQCGTAVCPQYSMLNAVVNHVPYPSNNPQDKEPMFADNCYCTYNYAGTHCFSTSYKRLKCARCAQIFYLTQTNEYMWKDECVYHWGKFIEKTIDGCPVGVKIWSCCEGDATSPGCSMAKWHVWTGVMPGYNPLRGFMRSKKPKIHPRDGFYGIYGLDCEMCFTRNGLEIIQIAIVDMNGTAIYHSYVKPEAEVLDYNTRFSGITAGDLQGVEKTLSDVHRDIAAFIHEDTILIGHSLENDLRALRLLHKHCIDTSIVFPHYYGYPYRNSLKYLARRVLNRDIQEKIHDPAEDARTALDLMMIKLHSDSSSL